MAAVKGPRPYSSPRRDDAARATRRAVVESAAVLFVQHGYVGTTMEAIAERAHVSRPTVHAAAGGKAGLLRLARDWAMAGDDEQLPVVARPAFQEFAAAPDLGTALRLHARNVTSICARYAELDEVLHQAAGAEPELAALWQTSEQQRLTGALQAVRVLAAKGPLRLDEAVATDVLWLLMAPAQLHRLVHGRGWSLERYEAWLCDTMTRLLT